MPPAHMYTSLNALIMVIIVFWAEFAGRIFAKDILASLAFQLLTLKSAGIILNYFFSMCLKKVANAYGHE